MTLSWNIDGLLKIKYLSSITLIPQLDIVRTQSPFWKPGSVRHIAASGTWASDWVCCHEIGGILWQTTLAADRCKILLLEIRKWPKCNKDFFLFESWLQIRKFIFRQSESCVLTMSSWSGRVKNHGLKSSIEVQLPTVSGNLKKMLYSCLCVNFVSCYCVLMEKMDENGSLATIAQFSRLRVGSLLVSFGDSKVWPGGLLQATVPKTLASVNTPLPQSFPDNHFQ